MRDQVAIAERRSLPGRALEGLRERVPQKLWSLGRGVVEMAVLASAVPVASEAVVTGIFVGYSLLATKRLLRRSARRITSDASESDVAGLALLRVHDELDATEGFLDDLGRTLPLSLTVIWFGASVPAHAVAGYWGMAGVLGAAACAAFVPLFMSVRSGLFNAWRWWKGRRALQRIVAAAGLDEDEQEGRAI